MKIGKAIVGEILNPSIDISIDYGEVALDSILEDGILKDVPIISTVISGVKTALAIRDKRFVKKTLVFLQEINSGHADPEKVEEFREKLMHDKSYNEKITELIITMIDNHLQEIQSKVFARLVISHINGEIDYEMLLTLSVTLDKLHPAGYEGLRSLDRESGSSGNISGIQSSDFSKYGFNSMYEGLLFSAGVVTRFGTALHVNDIGKYLYKYGIRHLYSSNTSGV